MAQVPLGRAGRTLRKLGLYGVVRRSPLYERVYERLTVPAHWADRQRDIRMLREVLGPAVRDALVFDVGANVGFKTSVYLTLGARVVAIEPGRESYAHLAMVYGPHKRVTTLPVAVGDKEGRATLFAEKSETCLATLSERWKDDLQTGRVSRFHEHGLSFDESYEVDVTTLDALIARHGRPYYLKIDVEGYERQVLAGLGTSVPFTSFEANLPEFRDETLECIDRLATLAGGAARFNYQEHDGLCLPEWVDAKEIAARVRGTELPYMEIWARA